MLLLIITSVLILMQIPCMKCNVGSVIFRNHRIDRKCWNQEDLDMLRARKLFEDVCVPVAVPPDKIDRQYIKDVVNYFRKALQYINGTEDLTSNMMIHDALADAIGGHLHSEILPNVRMAYYAGYIPFKSANHIHKFHEEIKKTLDTQGLGWRTPSRVPKGANLTVSKIVIGSGKLFDPCACLLAKHDSKGCIHVPSPKLDDAQQPSAIAMPFKSGGFVSLTSPKSENLLLKYYTSAARCILNNSPEVCRHEDFVSFNNQLWHWMKREIAPHLLDTKLYAAFGGVLRVAAAVQNYGKIPSKRNLDVIEEFYDEVKMKNHPVIALTQPHLYVCSNWTPELYVGLVLATAFLILCLQLCYNYIFNRCCCYYPPPHYYKASMGGNYNCISKCRTNCSRASTRSYRGMSENNRILVAREKNAAITGQTPQARMHTTQPVYDLNDNKEKMMSVIMSEYESSVISNSSTSESDATSEEEDVKNYVTFDCKSNRKPSSPPMIQAHMAELKIERTSADRTGLPVYTSSIVQTQSEITTFRSEQGTQKLSARSAASTKPETTSTESNSSTRDYSDRRHKKACCDSPWSRKKKPQTGDCTTSPQTTGRKGAELN